MQKVVRESSARQGGWFFLAAGVLTILNNFVPGGEYLDKGFMFVLGLSGIALGVGIFFVPWRRWPAWVELTMPVLAFGLVALANDKGSVSAYTFGTFFDPHAIPFLGLTDPRTLAPGMPLAAYAGLRATF